MAACTIGLGVAPTDVEVGAGSVWILSDWALLRVDPAINDVVDTVPLPRGSGPGRWSHMEVGANAVFVCSCAGPPGAVIRIDPATRSVESVRRSPVWMIAYGEGALWALTGYELDTIERIDPKTNAVVETIPLGRIGESSGWRYRMAVGEGAIWVLAPASLWRIGRPLGRTCGWRGIGLGGGHVVRVVTIALSIQPLEIPPEFTRQDLNRLLAKTDTNRATPLAA